VGPLKDVTIQAASFIGQLVTVLALGFLLLLHGRQYVNLGLSLAGDREERYRQIVIEINKAVADYVLGNIVISVLATIATWIVLTILGVPYALSLGSPAGYPYRRGDPDRAARVVGQSHAPGPDRPVVTHAARRGPVQAPAADTPSAV